MKSTYLEKNFKIKKRVNRFFVENFLRTTESERKITTIVAKAALVWSRLLSWSSAYLQKTSL